MDPEPRPLKHMQPPFVLGTVQLGRDYGITNISGAPSKDLAFAILDAAWDAGVRCFDTARGYGDAEGVIGTWMRARGNLPAIITKIPPIDGDTVAFKKHLQDSLGTLGVSHVEAILLHNAKDYRARGVAGALSELSSGGLANAVGVSIYDVDDLPIDGLVTVAQMPANVFVQQAAQSSRLRSFVQRGGRLFVRSVLVQGLLVAEEADMPNGFEIQKRAVRAFRQIASDAGISSTALAIQCARQLVPDAQLVLGADSVYQVHALAEAARTEENAGAVASALALGDRWDSGLFDPRTWPSR